MDVVVEVAPREGFQAAGSANAVIALHAELDEDLRQEGLSRELLNRIQGQRKDLDLGYTDRIVVRVGGDAAVRAAAERFGEPRTSTLRFGSMQTCCFRRLNWPNRAQTSRPALKRSGRWSNATWALKPTPRPFASR